MPRLPSSQPAAQNVEAISNSTLQSSGFLGAPQPLATGVLEGNEPTASNTASGYVVQVGALNDAARAQQLMKSLSQRYGAVETAGNVYRVQLGGYPTRAEAAVLQQRLSSDGQTALFITNTRR